MTLIVKSEETDRLVDSRSLKGNNFYHFHGIAVPRINDLLFRRRLFGTVWSSRKEALARIKGFLGTGKQFNGALLEEDLSIQRDYILMFGSKDQISKVLHEETGFLPPNQTHKHHEKYALIAQLGRSRPSNADLESSHEDALLLDTLALIDRTTPKVTASWIKCWVEAEEEEGVRIGPYLLAPNEDAAGKFETELNEALENFTSKHRGLCAFGFIPPDPLLFTPKIIEQEKRFVTEIVTILQDNAAKEEVRPPDPLDLNERKWNPERLPASEAD